MGRPHIGEGARCIIQSCREVEPETVIHSLLMIFTTESGMRSSWLLAALEAVLLTFYLWQVYATGILGRQESSGSPGHKLRARQMGLTPPDVEISTTVTTSIGKDSPIGPSREGSRGWTESDRLMDIDPSMNRTMRQEQRQNSFSCEQCNRNFGTLRGLKVHQGKTCKKKNRPCRSLDRKTRSQSSQDKHHSGLISASVDSTSNQSQNEDQQPQEESARRPRVLWPAANEKEKYEAFEDKV